MLISSTLLIPVFPIYSLVHDPRSPASFYTHARNNATTVDSLQEQVTRFNLLSLRPRWSRSTDPQTRISVTTVKEAHVFRQVDSDSTPVVYSDSQGVVALSKNPVHHNASKHIDVPYHFIRDCVISRKLGLEKISTVDNVADGMTKCLSVDRFRSLRHQMGVTKNRSN